MPTYEYVCSSCANAWEEVQKISEPALEVCPKCHQHTAKRQISAGNFILKGGGWYADLYSSPKAGSSAKSDDGGGGSPEAKKVDTKPAAAKETAAPAAAAPAPAASSGDRSSGDT